MGLQKVTIQRIVPGSHAARKNKIGLHQNAIKNEPILANIEKTKNVIVTMTITSHVLVICQAPGVEIPKSEALQLLKRKLIVREEDSKEQRDGQKKRRRN